MDEEVALVQRCLARERRAVEEFVARYQRLVFGVCWRMLGQRQDAEDVAQESFARIFRHLHQWEPQRPLRPWLLAIVANRCRTRLTQRRKQPLPIESVATSLTQTDRSDDLAEELQRGLLELREDYRLCFVMFYDQQLSVQEIAATFDCPEGTVKTWLYRARKQLAAYLLERGVVSDDGYELQRA